LTQPRFESVLLEGSLVRVRPVCSGDARPAFEHLHGHPEILDWLIWDGPSVVGELMDGYAQWRNDSGSGVNYHFAIESLTGGAFLGAIGLRYEGHEHQGDIGYWIRSDAWGKGYASDALRLIDWLGFRQADSMLHYATVFVGNDASARVLEKTGYTEDPAGAAKVAKHGQLVERRFFSINRRAWMARDGEWEPAVAEVLNQV